MAGSVIVENLRKVFGKTTILDGLSLRCDSNQLTVFVGPSGCGKSTILRLIAGLEKPDAGEVFIDGQRVTDLPPFTRGVGMVFQSYALYPHMTVEENMRFGLSSLRLPKDVVQKRIEEAARLLELTPYLERKPKQLSGGQRQRVAMARAIVRQPKVFLFDEPLSNLDAALRVKMRLEIARLRATFNATGIYVTHDQVEAMTLAHKIVVLRAGRIEQEGPPLEVYHHPANKFVASFLGSPAMNFIPAKVDGRTVVLPGGSRVGLETASGAGNAPEFGIRPEHLSLNPALPCRLGAKVFAVEQLGDQILAHLVLDAQGAAATSMVARLPGDAAVHADSTLSLGFDPKNAHLFDETGRSLGASFGCAN